jgi:TonB family protein
MKKTMLFIFYFTSLICFSQNKEAIKWIGFSQNEEAIKLYDKGVKAFNKNDYKVADSLFTLSVKIEPHKDTYYNLAIAKEKLNDSCGFCDCLYKASIYGDTESGKLYNSKCLKTDTIFYKNIKEKNVNYFYTTTIKKCSKEKTHLIYKKYIDKGKIDSICFDNDSLKFKEDEIYSPNFEIEKVPYLKLYEEMPSFIGGDEARMRFLWNNIKYPSTAKENGIQGKVFITFIIDEQGQVTNVQILKGIGRVCDEEALRVVKMMPKWNPGKSCGKPVKVQYNMPIVFTLQ